jgi:predicted flap endonuclease-1-like 5' DNA nuclease
MGFLLIKMLLLLALAAVCGGLVAYWWFRRHYEDVTLDYLRTREEWQGWRRDFEERLAARPPVDLQPVAQQLAAVHAAVADIPLPEPADLRPLEARLAELSARVGNIAVPDLDFTNERLTAIEHALFPLEVRLDGLESAVRALRSPRPQTPEPESAGPPGQSDESDELEESYPQPEVAVREGSRNLLTHPRHGTPDDLTRIKGVPKVLEHTLHQVGVFYFWQIAEWSPEDVQYVDSQLDTQGRIERDEWVTQASELAELPSATPRPGRH